MARELNVRWHDQRNNLRYPYGTCNATSIATVMQWMGIDPPDWDKNEQLDDYVTRQLETDGAQREHKRTLADWRNWNPRNNHYVLKWYMEKAMGVKDELIISNVSVYFDKIKASIDKGMPVICAGNYTRKKVNGTTDAIGHINVVVGYTDTGFVFCDPFGNAMSQYQDTDGNHVEYPYQFCQNVLSILHILTPDMSRESVVTSAAPVVSQSLAAGVTPAMKVVPTENQCYFIAEGDSWFDYKYLPGGQDILSQINKKLGYYAVVQKDARVGTFLERMIVGVNGERPSLQHFIDDNLTLTEHQFGTKMKKIVLFSGGGNDVAGDSLKFYLNHKGSGLPLLREDVLKYLVGIVFRKYYELLIETVKKHPNTYIITHGYGYARPNGKGHQSIQGMNFAGPWLKPAFLYCGITNPTEQQNIIKTIIDAFHTVLKNLAETNENFHYLDLRSLTDRDDLWENEMHLTSEGYSRVADEFVKKIKEIQCKP